MAAVSNPLKAADSLLKLQPPEEKPQTLMEFNYL